MRKIFIAELSRHPAAWKKMFPNRPFRPGMTGEIYLDESKFRELNCPIVAEDFQIGPVAIPRAQWPLWAKSLALLAKADDKGIGDIIARTVGAFGGEKFKTWYKTIFGHSCACADRQVAFNRQFPLH